MIHLIILFRDLLDLSIIGGHKSDMEVFYFYGHLMQILFSLFLILIGSQSHVIQLPIKYEVQEIASIYRLNKYCKVLVIFFSNACFIVSYVCILMLAGCVHQYNSLDCQPDVLKSLYSSLQPSSPLEELRQGLVAISIFLFLLSFCNYYLSFSASYFHIVRYNKLIPS